MNNNLKQEMNVTIGKRLKEFRENQKLTQQKMADMIYVTCKAYQKYEAGYTCLPMSTLMYLCETFNVSADDILFGENTSCSLEDKRHFNNIVSFLKQEFRQGGLENE